MGHVHHAGGDGVRDLGLAAKPEREIQPAVADSEQNRGGQPIRFAEPVASILEEIRAVPAQEEQRHGVRERRIVALEELAGGGIREAGERFESVPELPDAGLQARIETRRGRGKVRDKDVFRASGTAGIPPLHQSFHCFPE